MVDALKRSAVTPSYVDMRDALIAADNADFNGVDQPEIWEGFARRGLGYMAVSGDGASLNILPSTELPSSTGRVRFFERTYYAGEALRIYVGDDNNRDLTATLRLETTGGDRETVTVSRSGVLYRAAITPIAGAAVPDDGKLQVTAGDTVRAFYLDRDDGTGANREIVAEAKVRAAYSTELRSGGIAAQDETALNLRGSNTTATVRLSFGFPFYGRLITSVIVSTNGLLTIGFANTSSTNTDLVTFARFPTIAPMWDALRTNGNAQAGEDVYVARTADTIRFRWVAETVAGNPVNFAVTLSENGDIEFSYGSGNTAVSPTVGISRGTETLTQIVSSYSSSVNMSLENAAAVHWSFPGMDRTTTVFPFFRGNATEFTGYAAANLGSTTADVLFTARADTGEKVISTTNPNSLELRAGSQLAQVGDQIIRPDAAGGNREGWVEAQSPSNAVSGFYLYGDNAQTYLDGTVASSRTARDLVFTRLQRSATSIYLVNPAATSAAAQLQWIDSAGNVAASVSRTIPARGRLAASAAVLFPQITTAVLTGYLRVTSNVGLAGVEVLAGTGSVTVIPAQEPSTVATLYSPQFASGVTGGIRYFTDLSLVNTSSASRSISILLVGNNGAAVTGLGITNPVTRTLVAGAQLRARGETLFGLPDAATGGTLYEGSLVIKADGAGVIGDVTFGDPAGERFAASLPLDGAPLADLLFAQVAEGRAGGTRSYFTGAAFYNPNTTTVTLTISVFSKRGIPVGSATLTLDPGARVARTLAQLVPGLTQLGGYVRVTSRGGAVASFAVYGDSALEFLAAVPPQRGN
jgi:hypothetical protein